MSSTVSVNLVGGSPWGFKLAGGTDYHQPLSVSKVVAGGKAMKAGMPEGYHITRINGTETSQLRHLEAMNLIKQSGFSVAIELIKPRTHSDSVTPHSPLSSSASSVCSNSSSRCGGGGAMESHSSNNLYRPTPKPFSTSSSGGGSTGRRSPDGSSLHQSPAFQKVFESGANPSMISKEPEKKIEFSAHITRMIKEEEEEKARAKQNINKASPSPPVVSSVVHHPNKNQAHKVTIGKFLGNLSIAADNKPVPVPPVNPREPHFAKTLEDKCKPLGEPIVLEVRLMDCNPTPSVHWYHNNKQIHDDPDKDIRILSSGSIHTLVLGELMSDLVGRYTCTIMNRNGSKSSRCNVTVEATRQSPRPAYMHSAPTFKTNHESSVTATPAARVLTSTNKDLYSKNNVATAYHNQVVRPTQRKADGEESEVLKAIRQSEPQNFTVIRKSRTMKFLEDQFGQDESEDL